MADEIKKPGVAASTEQADAASANLVQQDRLTPEEQSALDAYRSTRLVWDANNFLRGRESLVTKAASTVLGNEDMVNQVKHLDSAIKKSRLTEDATFVRGLALDKDPQEIFKPGGKFTDLGFISTSMAQPVAEKFSTTFTKHPVIMEVAMPRGASAHRMERQEGKYDESEFLLGRNSEFKVDSLSKREDGKTIVKLQYIDAEPTPIKPKSRLLPTAADAWQHFEDGGEVGTPAPTFNRFPAPGGSEPKLLKSGGSVPPSPGIPIDADEIPAKLQSGEFVMPREPAGKYKRELESMRAETSASSTSEPKRAAIGGMADAPHFATGGAIVPSTGNAIAIPPSSVSVDQTPAPRPRQIIDVGASEPKREPGELPAFEMPSFAQSSSSSDDGFHPLDWSKNPGLQRQVYGSVVVPPSPPSRDNSSEMFSTFASSMLASDPATAPFAAILGGGNGGSGGGSPFGGLGLGGFGGTEPKKPTGGGGMGSTIGGAVGSVAATAFLPELGPFAPMLGRAAGSALGGMFDSKGGGSDSGTGGGGDTKALIDVIKQLIEVMQAKAEPTSGPTGGDPSAPGSRPTSGRSRDGTPRMNYDAMRRAR